MAALWLTVCTSAILTGAAGALTPALAQSGPSPQLQAPLPNTGLSGRARLTVWGWDVYQASLWTAPGFRPSDYARHAFALELEYLRDFSSDAIARRSLDEMRRVDSFSPEQSTKWQASLLAHIPDVKKGDRLIGVNQPGVGLSFFVNARPAGTVLDAEFARIFFGIWLSPHTSQPKLRQALLGVAPP